MGWALALIGAAIVVSAAYAIVGVYHETRREDPWPDAVQPSHVRTEGEDW